MIKEILEFVGGYRLKSIKTMPGREGYAWHGVLYLNGEKLGEVHDAGDGGMMRNYLKRDDYEALKVWAESKLGEKMEVAEVFLNHLANYTDAIARFKKQAKTSTLIVLKDSKKDEQGISEAYIKNSQPFSSSVAVVLRQKHGDQLAAIINEDLAFWDIKPVAKKTAKP